MKTDLYTKIVLTIIAIALVGHLVKDVDLVSKAHAAPLPLEVLSTQTDGVIDVNIVQINGKDIATTDIPVKINNISTATIPVDVRNSYIYVKEW